jgi:hypothetical protein
MEITIGRFRNTSITGRYKGKPMHKFRLILFVIGMFICMSDADPLSLFMHSKLIGLAFCTPLAIEIIIKRGEIK